jgi:hypothetical protein
VYAYTKEYKTERAVVILNFTRDNVTYEVPDEMGSLDKPLSQIGNYGDVKATGRKINLRPYEGIVIVMQN